MAASHLLSHVKEQGIVTLLFDGECRLVDMLLTNLLFSTLCGSDVDGLAFDLCPLAVDGGERDGLSARIELRESVVVPQQSIALTGEQHGDGYLCIHLCQSAGKSLDVMVAVLKLSESVEILILR